MQLCWNKSWPSAHLRVLTISSRASALTGAGSRGRSSTERSKGSPGTICAPQHRRTLSHEDLQHHACTCFPSRQRPQGLPTRLGSLLYCSNMAIIHVSTNSGEMGYTKAQRAEKKQHPHKNRAGTCGILKSPSSGQQNPMHEAKAPLLYAHEAWSNSSCCGQWTVVFVKECFDTLDVPKPSRCVHSITAALAGCWNRCDFAMLHAPV